MAVRNSVNLLRNIGAAASSNGSFHYGKFATFKWVARSHVLEDMGGVLVQDQCCIKLRNEP